MNAGVKGDDLCDLFGSLLRHGICEDFVIKYVANPAAGIDATK